MVNWQRREAIAYQRTDTEVNPWQDIYSAAHSSDVRAQDGFAEPTENGVRDVLVGMAKQPFHPRANCP